MVDRLPIWSSSSSSWKQLSHCTLSHLPLASVPEPNAINCPCWKTFFQQAADNLLNPGTLQVCVFAFATRRTRALNGCWPLLWGPFLGRRGPTGQKCALFRSTLLFARTYRLICIQSFVGQYQRTHSWTIENEKTKWTVFNLQNHIWCSSNKNRWTVGQFRDLKNSFNWFDWK